MNDQAAHRVEHGAAVYVISVAADLAGVHAQTLRLYERRGLVRPARTAGGSRRYSNEDIALLARIAELKDDGLNLAGIKAVLRLEAENAALKRKLAASATPPDKPSAELVRASTTSIVAYRTDRQSGRR